MYVYRSNRMEQLADAMCARLDRPGDPFVAEAIVVQSRGMAQWLSLHAARRLGVLANVTWWTPRSLTARVVDATLGPSEPGLAWSRDRIAWTLMRLLPAHLEQGAFAPLSIWLGGARTPSERVDRRWQLCRRIAYLFDQYVVYRPDLVLGWQAGNDGDDVGSDAWQPALWRVLVDALGDHHLASRAHQALQGGPPAVGGPDGVPPRTMVFGLTTVPPLFLHLWRHADAVAPVHLFQLCPSDAWWADVRSARERQRALRGAEPDFGEVAEAEHHLTGGHPLLASLGRVGREFQAVLEDGPDDLVSDDAAFEAPSGDGMLGVLQSDILAVRARGADERVPIRAEDRSVMVLGCHSPAREVEVLRDELLARLQADPSLSPRDIVVMVPDVRAYGPLIDAVFGSGVGGASLPYTLADRPVLSGNDVALSLLELLGLVGGRLGAPDVLDLLTHAPLRRRFGFDADDVSAIEALVVQAGVRWGRDDVHRGAFEQPSVDDFTWAQGLERLWLGVAMDGAMPFAGRVPVQGLEGDAVALLGRVAAFADLVLATTEALAAPRSMVQWRDDLLALLARLFDDDDDISDEVQRIREGLRAFAAHAEEAGFDDAVPLSVVRHQLETHLLEERRGGAFLRRGITFCEMLPMRAIPARVVVMMGMSDGVFPRGDAALGFDLIARHRRVGDRSKRDDDRYLVLESLLSARDAIVFTYVSRSVQDNKVLPPSVVLSDVLDAIDATFAPPARAVAVKGWRPQDAITVHHPLQPFSGRYVREPEAHEAAADVPRLALFTYDRGAAEGATALLGPRTSMPPLLPNPLPHGEPLTDVHLSDLQRFLKDPMLWFLHDRLGIARPTDVVVPDDREPLDVAPGLEAWSVGDRMLALRQQGLDWGQCEAVLRGEGRLPIGRLAQPVLAVAARRVHAILTSASGRLGSDRLPPARVDVSLGGVRFTGRVDGLHDGAMVRLQYSEASSKGGAHRASAWVSHLALQLADGAVPRTSELYARRGATGCLALRLPPLDPSAARAHLTELVRLYVAAQQAPVPFLPDASWAYVSEVRTGSTHTSAVYKASWAARDYWSFRDASAEAWSRLVGGAAAFDDEASPLGFAQVSLRVFDALAALEASA